MTGGQSCVIIVVSHGKEKPQLSSCYPFRLLRLIWPTLFPVLTFMSKRSVQIGKYGEERVKHELARLGLSCVEKIGTPTKIIGTRCIRGKRYYRVVWEEKVAGDHRAVVPGVGTSVLVETKTAFDRNLRWSDFEEHQPDKLSEHAKHAISLVCWVTNTGIHILKWPIPGFDGKGSSITYEQAMLLEISSLEELLDDE